MNRYHSACKPPEEDKMVILTDGYYEYEGRYYRGRYLKGDTNTEIVRITGWRDIRGNN